MKTPKYFSYLSFFFSLTLSIVVFSCGKNEKLNLADNTQNTESELPKYNNEIEKEFDSVFVNTLSGEKIALIDYIDSIAKDTPIVIISTYLYCEGCNNSIKKVAEFKTKNPDFKIVALSIDQINKEEKKESNRFAKSESDLVEKLKKLKLNCPIIYNIDSSYTTKVLDGKSYTPQTYIIKNDSIFYHNKGGEYFHYQLEYEFVISALKSRKDKVIDSLSTKRYKDQINYAFYNLRRVGEWKKTENSKITWKGNFINGEKSGEWDYYYEDGKLKAVVNYKKGELSGIFKQYFENGQLKVIGNYANGKQTGEWKVYYDSGELSQIISFSVQGKQNTEFKALYKSGKPKQIGLLLNNEQEGEWKTFHDNDSSSVASKTTYIKGKQEGNYNEFHENGKIGCKGQYKDGKKVGKWTYYFSSGQVSNEGMFKDGNADGEWKSYYDNGQSKKVKLWKKGKLMDIISCFSPGGKPLDKGTIVNGNGTVKNYNSNGDLTTTKKYKNGTLVN